MAPLSDSIANSFGTAVISFDLSSTANLTQHQALFRRPGADQMQRRLLRRTVEGTTQRLAVDCDDAWGGLGEASHELHEAAMEPGRIEQSEQAAKRVVARDAVGQPQEPAQKRLLGPAEQGHVRAVLAAAQDR